jgi:hypothetical protein
MIIDTGCPKSLVGKKWLDEYMKEMKINKDDIKREECKETFKFGPSKIYEAREKVDIPTKVKTKEDKIENITVEAYIIQNEEIPLLCGKDMLEKWSTVINLREKDITIRKYDQLHKIKSYFTKKNHLMISLISKTSNKRKKKTEILIDKKK